MNVSLNNRRSGYNVDKLGLLFLDCDINVPSELPDSLSKSSDDSLKFGYLFHPKTSFTSWANMITTRTV